MLKKNRNGDELKLKAPEKLSPERHLAQQKWEQEAKITGVPTPTQNVDYPIWKERPHTKPKGPDLGQPYVTPAATMTTTDEVTLNEELGYSNLFDPLASRLATFTPGLRTHLAYAEASYHIASY